MIKFGTGGFRGIIGDDFTKQNIELIAQALANIIEENKSKKPVVIGYDYRFMSDHFANYFCEVLMGNNIKCILFDSATPTPAVMFATKDKDLDYGVMITASHNPYVYNGVKLFTEKGKDADITFTKKLEEGILKVENVKSMPIETGLKQNMLTYEDGNIKYVENICKFLSDDLKGTPLKIAFDCMYGVTDKTISYLKNRYQLNMEIVNVAHDAFFGFVPPAPNEKTLTKFTEKIVKEQFDIGLASDADGDRLGVIDSQGVFYSNNIIMAIIYYYLVKYRNMKGDVIKNNSTSYILDNLAKKMGFKCVETPVGFKYISQGMIDYDALIGGESSGGLTVRNYIFGKDGSFSTMLLIEALSKMKKSLKDAVKLVKEFAGYDSIFVEDSVRVKDKQAILDALKVDKPIFEKEIERVNTEDGYKYFFTDGTWANIRFSGTEPILRLYTEAYTQEQVSNNLVALHNFVDKYSK